MSHQTYEPIILKKLQDFESCKPINHMSQNNKKNEVQVKSHISVQCINNKLRMQLQYGYNNSRSLD